MHFKFLFCCSLPARDIDIHWWLVDLGLQRYIHEFMREGIITMEDLKLRREVTTDVFLEDALRMLPGHRKRVKREGKYLINILSSLISYSYHI